MATEEEEAAAAAAAAAPAREMPTVEPQVWKACAGTAARIPTVGSRVYYFPQGHAEQAASRPDFSALPPLFNAVLCRISAVRLHANPDTDEVFACISLDPASMRRRRGGGDFVSFAKILTPSDANNGGGFSVPRFCADSIFPRLDFNADPPAQFILVYDVHGNHWKFRHIYRGTPRRHLLTTGWSKFVNSKKLIAGDSVVFMRNSSGQILVGIRRTSRFCGPVDYSPCGSPAAALVNRGTHLAGNEGFSSNARGRVPAASVVAAVRLAGMELPFKVLYYARAGSADFVVAAEAVEVAMSVSWTTGMRVRMSVETEDSARMTWYEGRVSSVRMNSVDLWPRSPWRMLEVTWDEPEILQNVGNVSPWEVALVSASPQIESQFSVMKRIKMLESSEFCGDREGDMLFPVTELKSTIVGSLPSSMFSYSVFPAGMQGARHYSIGTPNLCDSIMNTNRTVLNDLQGVNASRRNDVSVELKIGGTSQSGGSSPPSQGSIQVLDRKIHEPGGDPVKKTSTGSIQLFGQVIHIDQPTNDDANREDEDTEGGDGSHGSSFHYPHKQLVVQCPRVSAVGACQ
ncbi:auxin response factor [Musa troglodytarum]|uniref:Auxin response factor n=1 Tax=Musa troglodytarum TaxID=320322 RepID=A0A9E7HXA1_9LILI|nr:auxin response factor [Musa troglodytarum]